MRGAASQHLGGLAWIGLSWVLLATFLVYAPSLGNGFTMDDRLVAMGVNDAGQPNPRIYQLQPLAVYFTTSYWGDTNDRDVLYRPLSTLSFALRHRLFGDLAWPAHLANVLLHLLATALVYALLRGLALRRGASLLGAALFGLHAVHSEVVANVVGRSELLAFCLGAAALLLWQRGEESRGSPRLLAWSGAAALLAGACLAKESAVAWAGFFFAFTLARRWRQSEAALPWRDVAGLTLRWAAVVVAPLALFLVLRQNMISAQGFSGLEVAALVNPIFSAPASVRVYTATSVLGYGLLLVAAPLRLAADYSMAVFEVVQQPWHWKFVLPATTLAVAGLGALRLRHRHAALFLAAAAFFGFSLMTSNLLFPIGTIFGERLLYAPSLAWPLLGAWAWECSSIWPARRRALLFAAGVWLGASGLVLVQRNPLWKDDATLFLHEARAQPRSVRMRVNAANVHHGRGELETAARHLEAALALDPEHALSWNNLAAIRLEQGRLGEAERAARRGLKAQHTVESEDPFKLRCNLGMILLRRGRPHEGVEELAHCLHLEPGFSRPWRELVALEGQGALEEGVLESIIRRGEAAAPGPYWELYGGMLAHRRGRYAEAAAILEGALARLPRNGRHSDTRAEGRLALADALLRLGRDTEAREALGRLVADSFAPSDPRALARQVLDAL